MEANLSLKTPQDFIMRGKQLLDADAAADALRLLADGVAKYPANPLLIANLGMAYLRSGEREPALVAFKQAMDKATNPPQWLLRGVAALEQEVIELHGVTIAVPPEVVSAGVLRFLVEGGYERRELALLRHNLKSGDRVLELGAGLGFLACAAGREQPGVEYIAVEANPRLIPVIEKNFEINRCRARLLHGVASTAAGIVSFNMAEDFWASSACRVIQNHQAIEVAALDVNEIIGDFSPTMLVIDIEGGELELSGQLELSGVERIIVEMHPDVYGHDGSTKVIRSLLDQGFDIDVQNSGSQVFLFIRC
jgi:FkbM family methyltransferase